MELGKLNIQLAADQSALLIAKSNRATAEHEIEVQLELSIKARQASASARAMAEKKYRQRAVDMAGKIQAQALRRAQSVTLKKSELMMRINAIKTSFADAERNDEMAQAQLAKVEASRIQAEAKARARVAQEASLLQTEASSAATAAYEGALAGETKLQLALSAALVAFTAKVETR